MDYWRITYVEQHGCTEERLLERSQEELPEWGGTLTIDGIEYDVLSIEITDLAEAEVRVRDADEPEPPERSPWAWIIVTILLYPPAVGMRALTAAARKGRAAWERLKALAP